MWEFFLPVLTLTPSLKLLYDKHNLSEEIEEHTLDKKRLKYNLDTVKDTSDHLLKANEDLLEENEKLKNLNIDLMLKTINIEELKSELLKDEDLVERLQEECKQEMFEEMLAKPVFKHKWVSSSSIMLTETHAKNSKVQDQYQTHTCEKCEMVRRRYKDGRIKNPHTPTGYFIGNEEIEDHVLIQFCPFEK